MLIRTAIVAATLAALPAGAAFAPAFAQDTKAPNQTTRAADARIDLMFAERDINKDGRITQEELAEYRGKLFAAADANKDGFLDSAEMAAFMRDRMVKRAAARLAAFDKNKDGKLTLDEVPGRAKRRFFFADANMDGALTLEEMQKTVDRRLRRRLTFVFVRIDIDRDGRVSKNEFADAANRFFRRFDRNGDKTVTREEVAAVLASFESRRGMRRFHDRGDRRGHRMMMPHMRDGWHRGPRREMRDGDRRGMRHLRAPDRADSPRRNDDDRRSE